MTTMQQPAQTAASDVAQTEPTAAVFWGFLKRILLIALLAALLFAATYAYGWYRAYRLSQRFMADADEAYQAGNYLNALTGSEIYNQQEEQYQQVGGYLDVERIWSGPYSWPTPAVVQDAMQRSQEIMQSRLTTAQAEQYIQANVGKNAPYFAEIYLRLGELYEAEGDIASARDVYESIPDLFPNREDLIQEAQQRLTQLHASQ